MSQLLVIFPATGLRFVAGIYTLITNVMGLNPSSMREFSINQGLTSIIAGFRIMLVILSSDAVMTKVSSYDIELNTVRKFSHEGIFIGKSLCNRQLKF